MTTGRGDAPKLDRILKRTIRTDIPLPIAPYVFNKRSQGGLVQGEWSYTSTSLTLHEKDIYDRILPEVDNVNVEDLDPFVLTVGSYTVSFVATAYEIPRSSWNQPIPNERIFRFADGSINTATLDALADDTKVSLQLPIHSTGTSERVVNVWHRRTDFEARDFAQTTDAGLVTVKDTRLLVRAPTGPWVEGDVITDDRGETRTIERVSEVGTRGRYLESLARLI